MIRLILTAIDGNERELQSRGSIVVRPDGIELSDGRRIVSQITTWEFEAARYTAIRIEGAVQASFRSESGDRDLGDLEAVSFPDGTISADGQQLAVRDDSGTRWLAADDHSAWTEFVVTEP